MQIQVDRIVREGFEVELITGLGKGARYLRIKDGTFPQPIVLGRRKDGRASLVGFRMSDLLKWIADRETESPGELQRAQ
jgi:predicted DNA-binding transcriptional regulator AlpA